MNKLKSLALAALATFGLSAYGAGVTTNNWWDVTFETASFQDGFPGLTVGELGTLTNNEAAMAVGTVQPYTNGVWTAVDGDESYVTNEYNTVTTNGVTFGSDYCIKLDTQGNDLTWTPADTTNGVKNIVDADLYLVGSDSEPAISDFDGNKDVQTAIYLKNETNADSGETTNSILCVYVYNQNIGSNAWQELDGIKLEDNAWAHVQVMVDHSKPHSPVSVTVNGTQMHARGDAGTVDWWAANYSEIDQIVSSVAFRGTGAVDNFVGKTVAETSAYANFTVQTFVDDNQQGTDVAINPTKTMQNQLIGPNLKIPGFQIDNYTEDDDATYCLSKIIIYAPDGTIAATINYSNYDGENIDITPDVDDSAYFAWGLDENDDRDGSFSVIVPTAGANDGDTVLAAKVYFTSFNPPSPSKPSIDVGGGLDGYTPTDPNETVPEPISFEEATSLFQVSFVPTVEGWYMMMTCSTPSGDDADYVADINSAVEVTAANGKLNKPVTLTETTAAGTAKFVKIGWSATDPNPAP